MTVDSPGKDSIDSEVRDFIALLSNRSAALRCNDPKNYAQRRSNAEIAREPLTVGGPLIDQVHDYDVPAENGDVKIRVFNAKQGDNMPALVYLHGGGWMLFSLKTHDRLMRELAAGADIAVVGVEYSLSPDAKYPAQLNEVLAVIKWLRGNADRIGVDVERLAIGGDSAGANLSIAASLALRSMSDLSGFLGLILCYGVYDARFDTASYCRYDDPAFLLEKAEMEEFWTCYTRTPEDYKDPLVSPLRAELEGLPPSLMIIAERDVLYAENVAMAKK